MKRQVFIMLADDAWKFDMKSGIPCALVDVPEGIEGDLLSTTFENTVHVVRRMINSIREKDMKIEIKVTRNNSDNWHGEQPKHFVYVPENLNNEDVRGMPIRLGEIATDILKKASVRKVNETKGETEWQALEYQLSKLQEIVCKLRVARNA